jgi:hypothetical protein
VFGEGYYAKRSLILLYPNGLESRLCKKIQPKSTVTLGICYLLPVVILKTRGSQRDVVYLG